MTTPLIDTRYFVARCRGCDLDMPFSNPHTRRDWAREHHMATGHLVQLGRAQSVHDELQLERPGYVYVASSWRCPMQPAVVAALTAAGIPAYDFRNPRPGDHGFSWRDVQDVPAAVDRERAAAEGVPAKGTDHVPPDEYRRMLAHPVAARGFAADFEAMRRADTFVLVLPCGRSAHLELGWAVGAGKRTAVLLDDPVEPELMYRMVDHLATSMLDLLGWLGVED